MSRPPSKITTKQLQKILDNLYYARESTSAFTQFEQLSIIQCAMDNLDHIVFHDSILLEYAVHQVLSMIIETELRQQRYVLKIPHRRSHIAVTQLQAMQDIQQDALTRSLPLIGWSLLYHIYMRPELNISLAQYSCQINVDIRTVRRYRHAAVNRLLHCLIYAEANAQLTQELYS